MWELDWLFGCYTDFKIFSIITVVVIMLWVIIILASTQSPIAFSLLAKIFNFGKYVRLTVCLFVCLFVRLSVQIKVVSRIQVIPFDQSSSNLTQTCNSVRASTGPLSDLRYRQVRLDWWSTLRMRARQAPLPPTTADCHVDYFPVCNSVCPIARLYMDGIVGQKYAGISPMAASIGSIPAQFWPTMPCS